MSYPLQQYRELHSIERENCRHSGRAVPVQSATVETAATAHGQAGKKGMGREDDPPDIGYSDHTPKFFPSALLNDPVVYYGYRHVCLLGC